MTLSAVEFIRRFLMHILPQGFMRIRHFGLFANRGRKERLRQCREMLGVNAAVSNEKTPWWEAALKRSGKNPLQCPACKNGLLRLVEIVLPEKRRLAMIT